MNTNLHEYFYLNITKSFEKFSGVFEDKKFILEYLIFKTLIQILFIGVAVFTFFKLHRNRKNFLTRDREKKISLTSILRDEYRRKYGLPFVQIKPEVKHLKEEIKTKTGKTYIKHTFVFENQSISEMIFYENVSYEENKYIFDNKEVKVLYDHIREEIVSVHYNGRESTFEELFHQTKNIKGIFNNKSFFYNTFVGNKTLSKHL